MFNFLIYSAFVCENLLFYLILVFSKYKCGNDSSSKKFDIKRDFLILNKNFIIKGRVRRLITFQKINANLFNINSFAQKILFLKIF
jgi:hypothetical protein